MVGVLYLILATAISLLAYLLFHKKKQRCDRTVNSLYKELQELKTKYQKCPSDKGRKALIKRIKPINGELKQLEAAVSRH